MGPLSPLVLLKYADVLASLGSPSKLKAARAYYSQALRRGGLCVGVGLGCGEVQGLGGGTTAKH